MRLITLLIVLLIAILNITTYSTMWGFSRDYHGQLYIDTDTNSLCFNEDCSKHLF